MWGLGRLRGLCCGVPRCAGAGDIRAVLDLLARKWLTFTASRHSHHFSRVKVQVQLWNALNFLIFLTFPAFLCAGNFGKIAWVGSRKDDGLELALIRTR